MHVINATKKTVDIRLDRADMVKIMSILASVEQEYEELDPSILQVDLQDVVRISKNAYEAVSQMQED